MNNKNEKMRRREIDMFSPSHIWTKIAIHQQHCQTPTLRISLIHHRYTNTSFTHSFNTSTHIYPSTNHPLINQSIIQSIITYQPPPSQDSFATMRRWVEELRTRAAADIAVVVVGNKADLAEQRQVTEEMVDECKKVWLFPFTFF